MRKRFIILLISLPQLLSAQKIEGVITYHFNSTIGSKPDIGAGVYIADSVDLSNNKTIPETIDSFFWGDFNWNFFKFQKDFNNREYRYSSKKERRERELEKKKWEETEKPMEIAQCKKYGINSEEDYSALDKRAYAQCSNLKYSSATRKTIVDGSGKYSIDLPKGTYYVLIESKGRKNDSHSRTGKIYFEKIVVNSIESKNVSYEFHWL